MPHHDILDTAAPQQHLVQMYGNDDGLLCRNVSRYLRDGLAAGDGALVIADRDHMQNFIAQLASDGVDALAAIRDGRLVLLDAAITLSRFMVDGQPDWNAFQLHIGGAIAAMQQVTGRRTLRAYGEMVALLWADGQRDAALRLEDFWNRIIAAEPITLFCSYPLDVFADADPAALESVVCAHSHVVSHGHGLESALRRAVTDVLGTAPDQVDQLAAGSIPERATEVPAAEAIGLWLHRTLGPNATEVFDRARHYERAYLRDQPQPLAS